MSYKYTGENNSAATNGSNGTYKQKNDDDFSEKNGDKIKNKVDINGVGNNDKSETKSTTGTEGDEKGKEVAKRSATFGELYRYASCFDVLLMILGSLMALVHGAGWPFLFIFFGDMTDTFVSGPGVVQNMTNGTNVTKDELLDEYNKEMTKYSLYYIYIGVAVTCASYLQVACWTTTCERQVHKIRKHFYDAILRQEIGWFDVHQSGELTSRLADDLERVREGLGDKMSFALQSFAAFLAGFIIGFIKGWKLALVMMSLTPLLAVGGAFMAKMMATYTKREQDSYAAAGSVAEEVLSCIRTVTSFNGQNQDLKRYDKSLENSKNLGIKKAWFSGVGMGFTFLVMFSAYALAFWYGTEQVKVWYENPDDGISPGTVLTVFFCVLVGTFSIGNITPHVGTIAGAKGAAAVLLDIIDNKPSIDASSEQGKRLQNITGNIELKGVDFTYPTRKDVQILKNFNLSVQPGQTVALVGPSGCGKSTVINLLQRFYDVDQGQVLIDGNNITDLHLKTLRQQIGVVSQEPILFGLSIKENIRLGRPDATPDDIVRAAKQANCHNFIMELPKQYDTLVGERGAQISGGQKQRVAIARALVRDPKILLLDEATSALDSESERVVQEALDNARVGRTTIVIAHRLSTIQNADVIYVVQDGQIVESGKHGDLMAKQGAYHQLVTLQMLVEEEGEDGSDVDDEEKRDILANGVPRKRTISDSKTKTQLSKQTSRQLSRQDSKLKDVKEEEEEVEVEKADPAKYCPMVQANGPEWPFIVMGVIAASINGTTMPVFSLLFAEMIRVFMNKGEDSVFWSMMFLALGGVQFITNTVQSVAFGHSGEKLTQRLRLKTFHSLLRQDMSYFDDPKHSTGALATRLATDASLVKTATGIRMAILVQTIVSCVAALFIAFYYGWQLALVVLGSVPLMAAASAIQMKAVMGTQKKDNVDLEAAGKTASESIENIRTVQSLTREQHFYDQYTSSINKPYLTNMKMAQLYGLAYGFSQGMVFFVYAGAFRFGAYMVTIDEMTADNVFKVFFAISITGMTIGQSASFLPDYSKAAAAGGIIFKMINLEPLIDNFSKKGKYPSNISGRIEFKDLQFSYPMRPDVPVLKGINITVQPGQTVALVGPSGCGKSTTISLLQRFYDPHQGSIEVDGENIKDINLTRLRYLISVVSQEPILFDCSIRDNITYGLDTPIGMDQVISATRSANIHEFIANLPNGYDTEVGEKGTQLSGGQKQRVAIARALVRDPRILLLDEATSALDTESEQVVQAALDNAQEGRTCIVIAHRLSTIQNADVIYVIDAGRVVEYGSHQQLVNKKGVYAQLVSGQQLAK